MRSRSCYSSCTSGETYRSPDYSDPHRLIADTAHGDVATGSRSPLSHPLFGWPALLAQQCRPSEPFLQIWSGFSPHWIKQHPETQRPAPRSDPAACYATKIRAPNPPLSAPNSPSELHIWFITPTY